MKVSVELDEQKRVKSWASNGNLDNSNVYEVEESIWKSNWEAFLLQNDELVYDDNLKKAIDEKRNITELINLYKKMLNDTDYKAIKYSEGIISEDEYAETKEKRKFWRKEINRLEESLNNINKIWKI
ncbi:MAG: hypothetical protein Q4C64_06750 [Erysipelotrichia bacterium]|nr:hypothetical protein [Erysipelotrichia bacterium]